MKKSTIIIIALLLSVAFCMPTQAKQTQLNASQKCEKIEQKIKAKYKNVRIYKSSEKCQKAIMHRKNKKYYVVEKATGTVLNNNGDGKTKYGYISYRDVKNAKKGNKIVSYFVYRKGNNYCDDIIARYDVIIQ